MAKILYLAPCATTENGFKFYLNNRVYDMTHEGAMSESHELTGLSNTIKAFESFRFNDNSITWFNENTKFIYDIAENHFINNLSIVESNESFTNHVLATGQVKYENRNLALLFESLPTLIKNFVKLDFVSIYENKQIRIELFKTNEGIYISKFNTDTRISKFFKSKTATAALSYVNEHVNLDARPFLLELLEDESNTIAESNKLKETYLDMISFLKDQRGLLAESDKTIPEIKAADTLINSEILILENKLLTL